MDGAMLQKKGLDMDASGVAAQTHHGAVKL
jgi:hypothetical protein